jgi:hypothetical protein
MPDQEGPRKPLPGHGVKDKAAPLGSPYTPNADSKLKEATLRAYQATCPQTQV